MDDRTDDLRPKRLTEVAPLAMASLALPLFVWSAFNADFFGREGESFIIPLAVFFGGPIALAAGMWAYHHREAYLATIAGVTGAFWLTYGMLLWLMHSGVVDEALVGGDLRGLLFAAWAVTFAILWLASIREHWTLSLVTLGMGLMFVFLSAGYYRESDNALRAGGWIGFLTAAVAWYGALAELLNAEFEHEVLPTDLDSFRRLLLGAR